MKESVGLKPKQRGQCPTHGRTPQLNPHINTLRLKRTTTHSKTLLTNSHSITDSLALLHTVTPNHGVLHDSAQVGSVR